MSITPIDTNKLKWWAHFFAAKPLFAMGCFCVLLGYVTYKITTASYEREINTLKEELKRCEGKDVYYEARKRNFEETILKKDSVIDFLRERDRNFLLEQMENGKVILKAK